MSFIRLVSMLLLPLVCNLQNRSYDKHFIPVELTVNLLHTVN